MAEEIWLQPLHNIKVLHSTKSMGPFLLKLGINEALTPCSILTSLEEISSAAETYIIFQIIKHSYYDLLCVKFCNDCFYP